MNQLDQKPIIPAYAYIIVALTFLVNFIANYPQYQLSPLAVPVMTAYDIDIARFSMLFSSAMIPGILLGLPSGLLCDKYGVKACVGIAGIISFLAIVARIFTVTFPALLLTMVISGFVASFLNSNLAKIMGSWFPPEKIGIMVGIGVAGSTASMAVAMGTTAMLPGIKAAFIVAAVINAVVLTLWFLLMKNKPKSSSGEAPQMPEVSMKECLGKLVKIRHIWVTGLAIGFILAASMCLMTFLPTALQSSRGLSATAAGAVSSAIMFGNLAGAVLGPMICAKVGYMKPFLFVSCVLAGLGAAFAWLAPLGIIMIGALFLTGFIASGAISQLLSIPVMLKEVGPIYAGTAGGLIGTIQLIIGVGVPSYIIAPVVGANFFLLYLIAGALAVVSAVLVLTLPELFGKGRNTEHDS